MTNDGEPFGHWYLVLGHSRLCRERYPKGVEPLPPGSQLQFGIRSLECGMKTDSAFRILHSALPHGVRGEEAPPTLIISYLTDGSRAAAKSANNLGRSLCCVKLLPMNCKLMERDRVGLATTLPSTRSAASPRV